MRPLTTTQAARARAALELVAGEPLPGAGPRTDAMDLLAATVVERGLSAALKVLSAVRVEDQPPATTVLADGTLIAIGRVRLGGAVWCQRLLADDLEVEGRLSCAGAGALRNLRGLRVDVGDALLAERVHVRKLTALSATVRNLSVEILDCARITSTALRALRVGAHHLDVLSLRAAALRCGTCSVRGTADIDVANVDALVAAAGSKVRIGRGRVGTLPDAIFPLSLGSSASV